MAILSDNILKYHLIVGVSAFPGLFTVSIILSCSGPPFAAIITIFPSIFAVWRRVTQGLCWLECLTEWQGFK